ncbi:MAG: DUF3443 domain-containing protein [Betaproteobacteria bacterium]
MSAAAMFLAPAVAVAFALAGCGGGGDNNGPTPPPPTDNTVAAVVDAGPGGYVNLLFVSVTVCAPGASTNCQTIDHVQVDTGSNGLRIFSSVLSPAVSLQQQRDANGNPIVECTQFADGVSWGPVKIADVRIAGELASSVPIQVIGDPAFATIPASCSNLGPPENDVPTFGANGLLGVGFFLQDCGAPCAQLTIPGTYYICPASGCQPARIAVGLQVQNPAALFAADNNGVIIRLPSVPAAGAATVTGSLVFGIGTQSNNSVSGFAALGVDATTGNLVTVFNNKTYSSSYVDAGSNGTFFGTGLFPNCSASFDGFYCPPTAQNLTAIMRGNNGTQNAVNFSVGNAEQLVTANPNFYAFNNLAGSNPDTATFAWGLPFFYGRSVFTAIEGRSTPAGVGPYVAF